MSNPQGSSVVNASYITNLTNQINAIKGVNACAELQTLANEAMSDIESQLTAIRAQIASLAPIIQIPGASLGGIITWITSFVDPLIKATATYEAQLTEILSAVAGLTTAIENAAGRLVTCSVTIPPVT